MKTFGEKTNNLEISCSISLLSTILKGKKKTCKNNWSIHIKNYNLRNKKEIHKYIGIHFMRRYKSIISTKYRKDVPLMLMFLRKRYLMQNANNKFQNFKS